MAAATMAGGLVVRASLLWRGAVGGSVVGSGLQGGWDPCVFIEGVQGDLGSSPIRAIKATERFEDEVVGRDAWDVAWE